MDQEAGSTPRLRVEVTEACIARGKPRMPHTCPVVIALAELGVVSPVVTRSSIAGWVLKTQDEVPGLYQQGSYRFFQVDTPDHVHEAIVIYDATGRMEPIAFEIELERRP